MNDNCEKQDEKQPAELPDFKGEYFWAFCSLMLYKIGGFEIIKLEHLEQFDYEKDATQVTWDAKHKAFIMRFKEDSKPKPVAISVPGKIRKKLLKQVMKENFS